MEMQDNEFDELFRSKLDDFEVEPSEGVWTGLVGELAAGKRRKYLFPLLSIAASILILVAAGVLFIPHAVKINGKKTAQNRITKTTPSPTPGIPAKVDINPVSSKSRYRANLNETEVAVNNKGSRNRAKATGNPQGMQANLLTEHKPELEEPLKTDDQSIIAAVPQKQQAVNKPVVPDEATELTTKQSVEQTTPAITKPSVVTAQLTAVNKQDAVHPKPRHKIHSLGDFLNVVVAAVDKRRDKIIEFSDTDDDESTITGINLGVIKIKKEK